MNVLIGPPVLILKMVKNSLGYGFGLCNRVWLAAEITWWHRVRGSVRDTSCKY